MKSVLRRKMHYALPHLLKVVLQRQKCVSIPFTCCFVEKHAPLSGYFADIFAPPPTLKVVVHDKIRTDIIKTNK